MLSRLIYLFDVLYVNLMRKKIIGDSDVETIFFFSSSIVTRNDSVYQAFYVSIE